MKNDKICFNKSVSVVFVVTLLLGMLTFALSQLSNKQTSTNTRAAQPSLKNASNNSASFDLTANLKITLLDESNTSKLLGDVTFVDPIVLNNEKYYFRINIVPTNTINKKIPIFCDFMDNGQPYGTTSIRPAFYVDPIKNPPYYAEAPYNTSSKSKGTHVMTITCDGVNFGDQISFLPSKSRSFIFTIK